MTKSSTSTVSTANLIAAIRRAKPPEERPEPPGAHVSGSDGHAECPRRWALGDRDWGLHWTPRFPPSALFIGGLVHDVTFLYYHRGRDLMDAFAATAQEYVDDIKAKAPGEELWEEERERIRDDLILTQGMLRGYLAWQDSVAGEDHWADSQLEYLEMERAFHVTYRGVPLEGRIDGLARRRDTGELVVIERKTCRSIEELKKSLPWDFQPKVYAAAAELIFGEDVPYVLYDMLQKTDPYNIPLLKNGLPSKAKANVSTAAAYLTVLQERMDALGMSEKEEERALDGYREHLNWLLSNPPTLYERWAYPIGVEEKKIALEAMRASYNRMRKDWWALRDGRLLDIPAHLNRFRCPQMCEFKQVCAEMNRGGPWESLLEAGFVRGEPDAASTASTD